MVVLKNDGGVLPLAKTATCAGRQHRRQRRQHVRRLDDHLAGRDLVAGAGATSVKAGDGGGPGAAARVVYPPTAGNRAGATVGVAVIGETPYSEGCGDIPTPSAAPPACRDPPICDVQSPTSEAMAVKAAGLKTVVVLVVGRPMILRAADAIRGRDRGGVAAGQRRRRRHRRPVRRRQAERQAAVQWPRTMAQIPINWATRPTIRCSRTATV